MFLVVFEPNRARGSIRKQRRLASSALWRLLLLLPKKLFRDTRKKFQALIFSIFSIFLLSFFFIDCFYGCVYLCIFSSRSALFCSRHPTTHTLDTQSGRAGSGAEEEEEEEKQRVKMRKSFSTARAQRMTL